MAERIADNFLTVIIFIVTVAAIGAAITVCSIIISGIITLFRRKGGGD